MKRICVCLNCVRSAVSRIHLVDKCLSVFMLILLLQSVYSLFFHNNGGSESGNIDVIVRTASASIFGYFLSANFIRNASSPSKGIINRNRQVKPLQDDGSPKGQIGFVNPDIKHEIGKIETDINNYEDPESSTAGRLQVIAATVIGLICLLSLLVLRNISEFHPELAGSDSITATVAQFRDFVSGCVGFLIGSPTSSKTK